MGTGNNEFARGIDEMREYLHQDIREIPEPFVCEWSAIYEQAVTENVYNLSVNMSLKNSDLRLVSAGLFTMVRGRIRLADQEPSFCRSRAASRGRGEHYPLTLVVESIARQRQELLNESVPGGMMGDISARDSPFILSISRC